MPPDSLLEYPDLARLIELTAERASAAQRSADVLEQILTLLQAQAQALRDLVACVGRVEGMTSAMAAYLANRNGQELERLQGVLRDQRDISVHVDQQAGGARARDLMAESGRDVSVSGGNIERGE